MKLIIICILGSFIGTINAAVWYVDQTATGVADGTSWVDSFPDVQSAIDVAIDGDEIHIAAGLYQQGSTLTIINELIIKGAFAPGGSNQQNYQLYETVLDGENKYGVINVDSAALQLDGLTVINGFNGGIYTNASIVLVNCHIKSNRSYDGGGISGQNITLVNSKVTNNLAKRSDPKPVFIEYRRGGGIQGSEVLLISSEVRNNHVHAYAEEIAYARGGGVSASNITLVNSLVVNNSLYADGVFQGETAEGGGVFTFGDLRSKNSVLWGNVATTKQTVTDNYVANLNATYSLIELSFPNGEGNIDATVVDFEPGFVDTIGGDFHLLESSVLKDAGNVNDLALDDYDLDRDGDMLEYTPLDLDRNQRVFESSVDIGSYEWIRDVIFEDGFENAL